MSATWYCCRQRAGPLVKECRALRPSFSKDDSAQDRAAKAEIKKHARCAVNRNPKDKLELMLALMGPDSLHYTLTFSNEYLPPTFRDVRSCLTNFFKRSQRWRAGLEKPPSFDYIYAIEGLHGDHRYHAHFVCRDADLSPVEINPSEDGDWPGLWRYGNVKDCESVLLTQKYVDPQTNKPVIVSDKAFRRLAEYFNKEREDGQWIPLGRHPWSCSRSLTAKLEPPERWISDSGVIEVPDNVIYSRRGEGTNDFGSFYYASYVLSD